MARALNFRRHPAFRRATPVRRARGPLVIVAVLFPHYRTTCTISRSAQRTCGRRGRARYRAETSGGVLNVRGRWNNFHGRTHQELFETLAGRGRHGQQPCVVVCLWPVPPEDPFARRARSALACGGRWGPEVRWGSNSQNGVIVENATLPISFPLRRSPSCISSASALSVAPSPATCSRSAPREGSPSLFPHVMRLCIHTIRRERDDRARTRSPSARRSVRRSVPCSVVCSAAGGETEEGRVYKPR